MPWALAARDEHHDRRADEARQREQLPGFERIPGARAAGCQVSRGL